MSITSVSLSTPAIGALSVTGTFATDAVAPLTTTTTANNAVGQANIGVAASAGFPGRYITWPLGGFGGADGIVLALSNASGATVLSIASPGLLAATNSGTVLTRWDILNFTGNPKKIVITQANGDVFTWNAGDQPFTIAKTVGGSTSTLQNAVTVMPESIQFAPGILPDSTTYSVVITLVAN